MPKTLTVAPDKTWFCKKCKATVTQPASVTFVAHKCNPMGNAVPLVCTDS